VSGPSGGAPGPGRTPDPLDQERGRDGRLPDGVLPIGVPTERSGHNAFVLAGAATVALLGLIFTLAWVVFNQLSPADEEQQQQGPPSQSAPTQGAPTRTAPLSPVPTLD
jgi:hypothetical protein